jgi:Tol biopolymer transport system component
MESRSPGSSGDLRRWNLPSLRLARGAAGRGRARGRVVSLTPGARLGSYQIIAPLGSGGMGQVFRAHDVRLDRDVALKLLPEEFARDAERLARFEREARILAALNHPHIAAIYGVEERDGRSALVLELVEGRTLTALIQEQSGGQALPLEEALAIARQIADALEAAHERGIVHRDLKPDNVKVTPDGVVKVLDFGLGRASPMAAGTGSSPATTISYEGTRPGMVLGTPAYMSPEQARGLQVDKRTDIWAFGCVLFEMLTSGPVFGGDTASDVLADVLRRDPDWAELPERTPPAIRRLLGRCLQKDTRKRLRDFGDVRLELEDVASDGEERRTAVALARPAPEVRLARLTDAVGTVGSPAVSPDGKMVAFVAVAGGRRQIWIRMLAGGAPLQVTRDNLDHDGPRWMPDSSALVYYTAVAGRDAGFLWQVSALGGPPRRLAEAIGGADVSHDGRRLAFFRRVGDSVSLMVSGLDGSHAQTVLTLPPEFWCELPRWSPDDRLIAFQRFGGSFDHSLEVVAAGGGERRTVVRPGWMRGHSWLPEGPGHVYSSSVGSTMAYPPTQNLRAVRTDGSGDRQLTFGDVSYFDPDVHASGRLLATRVRSRSDVWKLPVDGAPADNVRNAVRLTWQTGQIQVPSVSPDGRELVYVSDNGGHANLWVATIDGGSARQLTFEHDPGVTVAVPMWAPAGDRIAFVRGHDSRLDVCLINADGTDFSELATDAFGPSWSGDGRSVYFSKHDARVCRVELETGTVVTVRSDRALNGSISRDGDALYFTRRPQHLLGVGGDSEICRAAPIDGPPEVLARVANARVPLAPTLHLHVSVSPDGRFVAAPLLDGTTANIWLAPTEGGPMRAVTDFGDRSVYIARWVSWSPDSRYVFAAVADTDTDIVLLDGLDW